MPKSSASFCNYESDLIGQPRGDNPWSLRRLAESSPAILVGPVDLVTIILGNESSIGCMKGKMPTHRLGENVGVVSK
jgi:hypothetical protein